VSLLDRIHPAVSLRQEFLGVRAILRIVSFPDADAQGALVMHREAELGDRSRNPDLQRRNQVLGKIRQLKSRPAALRMTSRFPDSPRTG